jgi:hypothetical protein
VRCRSGHRLRITASHDGMAITQARRCLILISLLKDDGVGLSIDKMHVNRLTAASGVTPGSVVHQRSRLELV